MTEPDIQWEPTHNSIGKVEFRPNDVLCTGSIGTKRIWRIKAIKNEWLTLQLLVWSEDCINERNVMFTTTETVRIKIKNNYVHNKKFGSAHHYEYPITIRQPK